jgi:hypothetical protein
MTNATHPPTISRSCRPAARLGGQGHRRLRHDRRGRSCHGVPVGRQGLLHAARHPVEPASAARRCSSRSRGQSRSEAAGVSGRTCCRNTWTELGVPFASSSRTPTPWSSASFPRARPCAACARGCAAAPCIVRGGKRHYQDRLGHHRDDIVETLFLNMFFGGKLKAMPPKLLSEDRRHIVIRPLCLRAGTQHCALRAARNFRSFPAICAGRRPICSASR